MGWQAGSRWRGTGHYKIPCECWVCLIGKVQITKQLMASLHTLVNSIPAEKYWRKKFEISDQLWKTIDWERLEHAYGESSMAHHHWQQNALPVVLVMARIWSNGSFNQCQTVLGVEKQLRTNHMSPNVEMRLQLRNGIWWSNRYIIGFFQWRQKNKVYSVNGQG